MGVEPAAVASESAAASSGRFRRRRRRTARGVDAVRADAAASGSEEYRRRNDFCNACIEEAGGSGPTFGFICLKCEFGRWEL